MSTRISESDARAKLQAMLPPGSTVHTILRHVSRSGMLRIIDLVVMSDNSPQRIPLDWLEALKFPYKYDSKEDGFRITGAGMDMGFALVYDLSARVYPNGFDCLEGWDYSIPYEERRKRPRCPASDHFNRVDPPKQGVWRHATSGAYAISQSWL